VDNQFWIVYGSENVAAVEQVQLAFLSPVYALTLGASDSLAKVVRVKLTNELVDGSTIGSTLVEGDIVPLILEQALLGGSFSLTISESDPLAYQLPTRFQYESDYGVRRVVSRRLFSFVGPSVNFKNRTFKGVQIDQVFVPIFSF
jgi:CRISPR-associated protein Cas5t